MQILEQIEIAQSKEVKRRNSRAQLLSTHPYSKKLEYEERELSKKHDADRKIAEKRIRDLLHKQQQLEKGCQKLIAMEMTAGAKSIEDINNKTSTFTADMKRWLQDMNIDMSGEEKKSKKCLENADTVLALSNLSAIAAKVDNAQNSVLVGHQTKTLKRKAKARLRTNLNQNNC